MSIDAELKTALINHLENVLDCLTNSEGEEFNGQKWVPMSKEKLSIGVDIERLEESMHLSDRNGLAKIMGAEVNAAVGEVVIALDRLKNS